MLLFVMLAMSLTVQGEPECPRGEAEPWLAGAGGRVIDRSFERSSRISSLERIALQTGEAITIEHGGCEYYTVVIRYAPAAGQPAAANPLLQAAGALETLASLGAASLFDLDAAATTLRAEGVVLGEELPVEGDGVDFLQTIITVVEPEDLPSAAVEIRLSKGPL